MYKKLAIIGALVTALAIPAGAAAKAIRPPRMHAQLACPQSAVILPGRDYGTCGGQFWFRFGHSGGLVTTGPAFWRHERMDRPDDHP